jgi:signal peptidase II
MPKFNSLQAIWGRSATFFLTALLVVAADQLSKFAIRANLSIGESLPQTGFFRLTHIHNTGAAFGIFQNQSLPLTILALVGVGILLFLVIFMYRRFYFLGTARGKLALGLILGGTVGNLIDRLSFGYVIDFIDIGIWPAFNIADPSVVIGAIVLAFWLIQLNRSDRGSDGQGI